MRMSELLNEVWEIEKKLLSERVTSIAFRKKTARVNPMVKKDIERMIGDRKYKGNTSGLMKDIKKKFPDEYESDIVQDMMKKHAETNEQKLDEAKFQINYSKGGKLFSKTINAKDEDDAESKAIKQFKIEDDDIRSVVKEAVSPAQQAAIAISKKERGEKPKDEKDEGNAFGAALEKARKNGDKTFVVSGKTYNVEALDKEDEPKVKEIIKKLKGASQAHAGQAKDLQKAVNEVKLSPPMIAKIKKTFEPLRGKKIGPAVQDKLMKTMDKIDSDKGTLIDLYKAGIPFVSQLAVARLISKHNMKADQINKLREEVELVEEPYVNTKSEYLVLIDKDNKIVAEFEGKDPLKDAKDSVRSAHLPPMRIPKNEVPKMRIVRMNKSGRDKRIGDKLGALAVGLKVKVGKMELDEAMYHHVLKNKVVASGSKSDMMKLVKKTGATVRKGPDTNYVLNSPGAKVGDVKEVNEKFTKKDFKDNEDSNHHTENGVEIVNMFGTSAEKVKMAGIAARHNMKGISRKDQQDRDALVKKYYSKLESVNEMSYKPGSFKDTRPQEKTAKAFDKYIKTGGLDQADFEKARKLYVQTSDAKSRMKLRDFIYNLDTAPTEEIMDLIGRNDPDTFMKMYPDAKSGERLSTISFRHKQKKIKTEEVELGEKYDLYHKDFSSAMQHAYDYAKKKMGITVDPKEIDSKVATGPKKPTEGKTNKYRLKGKGGNLQIQVYNKGGSKPFELNMYKEGADPLVSLYADQITLNAIKEK